MFSELATIQAEIDNLHTNVLSLVISTTANGQLQTSYAPYLFEGGYYYIPTSGITAHYQNMTSNTHVSLMIIEDEQQAKSICGRTRLSCQATTEIVAQQSAEFMFIINELRRRVGKSMDLLLAINDFKLFRISPLQGNLIIGLNKAYELYSRETLENARLPQLKRA